MTAQNSREADEFEKYLYLNHFSVWLVTKTSDIKKIISERYDTIY